MPNNAGGNGEGTNKQAREPPIDEQFSAKEKSAAKAVSKLGKMKL
jgi:hypothetical protein